MLKNYGQQGDVLLFPKLFLETFESNEIPKTAVETKTNVLQEGEHTGHAHRVYGEDYLTFEEPTTKVKYLRLLKDIDLRHEEHHEIKLPPGDYRIGIVKEYDHFMEEARQVAD